MYQSLLPEQEDELWSLIDWLSNPYSDDDETTENRLDEGVYLEPWDDEDTD